MPNGNSSYLYNHFHKPFSTEYLAIVLIEKLVRESPLWTGRG
jgi:hypothetical protein